MLGAGRVRFRVSCPLFLMCRNCRIFGHKKSPLLISQRERAPQLNNTNGNIASLKFQISFYEARPGSCDPRIIIDNLHNCAGAHKGRDVGTFAAYCIYRAFARMVVVFARRQDLEGVTVFRDRSGIARAYHLTAPHIEQPQPDGREIAPPDGNPVRIDGADSESQRAARMCLH